MPITDDAPYQAWMAAHDRYERAESRRNAAGRTGNKLLIARTQSDVERAGRELNAALRDLNDLEVQARLVS
ncbi:hypothetical protein GS397_00875 [Sphingobium yanoikuyae]|uniref:Uncharacterized protein n=1 Tax=Sphingobium yanoikuyae TaxID=13690 RepID=A0A6P1GC71_SPHYA|nr:hypothetical protein [Sphingobium yanoikuyae]QHD65763.1 hypothetical protein GS397_00875 [Sphingobium yanoikuyae]